MIVIVIIIVIEKLWRAVIVFVIEKSNWPQPCPGVPHEGVQGRQTKLHPGFTLSKLVQPSLGISILRDSHIVLSKQP